MAAKYGTGRHIIYATDPYHLGVVGESEHLKMRETDRVVQPHG